MWRAFFCPFYKILYMGFRKSHLQIAPDFCNRRKTRIITRYKIQYFGFRNLNLQIASKTRFRPQKVVSDLRNHFQGFKIVFKPSKTISSL